MISLLTFGMVVPSLDLLNFPFLFLPLCVIMLPLTRTSHMMIHIFYFMISYIFFEDSVWILRAIYHFLISRKGFLLSCLNKLSLVSLQPPLPMKT
jgi:hypothetical protein